MISYAFSEAKLVCIMTEHIHAMRFAEARRAGEARAGVVGGGIGVVRTINGLR